MKETLDIDSATTIARDLRNAHMLAVEQHGNDPNIAQLRAEAFLHWLYISVRGLYDADF